MLRIAKAPPLPHSTSPLDLLHSTVAPPPLFPPPPGAPRRSPGPRLCRMHPTLELRGGRPRIGPALHEQGLAVDEMDSGARQRHHEAVPRPQAAAPRRRIGDRDDRQTAG